MPVSQACATKHGPVSFVRAMAKENLFSIGDDTGSWVIGGHTEGKGSQHRERLDVRGSWGERGSEEMICTPASSFAFAFLH